MNESLLKVASKAAKREQWEKLRTSWVECKKIQDSTEQGGKYPLNNTVRGRDEQTIIDFYLILMQFWSRSLLHAVWG